jgi:uncharacterized membrane protein
MNKKIVTAAIAGAFAVTALGLSQVQAQDEELQKCYGVVKAGKNDCAGPGHTCQGQAASDGHPDEFILVPNGTCDRLVNGEVK